MAASTSATSFRGITATISIAGPVVSATRPKPIGMGDPRLISLSRSTSLLFGAVPGLVDIGILLVISNRSVRSGGSRHALAKAHRDDGTRSIKGHRVGLTNNRQPRMAGHLLEKPFGHLELGTV